MLDLACASLITRVAMLWIRLQHHRKTRELSGRPLRSEVRDVRPFIAGSEVLSGPIEDPPTPPTAGPNIFLSEEAT